MSGRVHPDDVIARLYEVVDNAHLSWLDGLLVDASLRRRCPCGDLTPVDDTCAGCGGNDDDCFTVYRCEPEATYVADSGCGPRIEVRIAAAGGGTPGRAYTDNDWIYAIHVDGQLWRSGHDLHSGAIGATHAEMAAVLADCLASRPGVPKPLADRLAEFPQWRQEIERDG